MTSLISLLPGLTILLLLGVLVSPAKAQDDLTYVDLLTQSGNQCYSLPYGALGFISHILTYYSVICYVRGIQPLTWKALDRRYPGAKKWREWLDRLNAVVALIIAIVIAARTMQQCADEEVDAW